MSFVFDLSDEQLLKLLKQGDEGAFTEIYSRYADSMACFAGAKLYSLDDAQDILHDIFVKLWEDRNTLNISSNLKSYLFAALRYRVIDKIRKNVTRVEYAKLILSLQDTFKQYNADRYLEASDIQHYIEKALVELPIKTQQIYRLSRDKHYTISEIARMLNISEQTVKNQLTIALKHLRAAITCLTIIAALVK